MERRFVRADGTGFVYSGYIGGSGDDVATGIAVDNAGNAYDHFLVWITKLAGPQAGIMEISLLAQKR